MNLPIKMLHNIPGKGNKKNAHQTKNSNQNNLGKNSYAYPDNEVGYPQTNNLNWSQTSPLQELFHKGNIYCIKASEF